MGHLELRDIRKEFSDGENTIVAVEDLNLDIKDGEFLILVGPSGCGKSTTLRCIAGLEKPSGGDIVLDNVSVVDRKPKARHMAMVFQNYALYPHMTARENMSFGLKMTTEMEDSEIERRVSDAADLMGIGDLLGSRPGELSGGQQQRVALGRAIVRDPEVFLMDEPLSNLDAKLRTQMRTELQNLHQNLDVTTIYVTHDQTEAMTMGDRIAVLNDGELQQVGTPAECYQEPSNQFVAGFIGSPSMNFFDVELRNQRLEHDVFDIDISQRTADALNGHGSQFTIGIRPEEIVTGEDAVGNESAFEVSVNVVEPLGDVTYLYTEIDGATTTISVSRNTEIESGDTVRTAFPEDQIHVFDYKTGRTLVNRGSPTVESESRHGDSESSVGSSQA